MIHVALAAHLLERVALLPLQRPGSSFFERSDT